MDNTFRIYGKIVNSWKHFEQRNGRDVEVTTQLEIEYTEYREDGSIRATGTEDFSWERYKTAMCNPQIWTWDGKCRNKGGHRWFDCRHSIMFVKSQKKQVMEYLKKVYPDAALIQLRA